MNRAVGYQRAEGWPRLDRDAVGRSARLSRDVASGMMVVPAGTVVRIDGTYNGRFHIEGEACSRCKVRVYVRKVQRESLVLLPAEPAQ